jgi:SlyX protein
MNSLEERLTELEVRLAFIDDGVSALNAAVAMQDRNMLDMRRELDRLRSDLVGLRSALGNDSSNEPPPPHY